MVRTRLALLISLATTTPSLLAGQTLRGDAAEDIADRQMRITVFADGAIKSALGDDGEGTGAGTGSLGILLQRPSWHLQTLVNVAASADSVSSGHSSRVLNPATGSYPSGLIDYHNHEVFRADPVGPIGLHVYLGVAKNRWVAADSLSSDASLLSMGVLLSREFVGSEGDEFYGIRFEAGLAYRSIGGDIQLHEEVLQEIFATTDRIHLGFEAGVQATVNKVTAGMQLYFFPDPEEGRAPGLTGFQPTFGFSINAAVFSKLVNYGR